MNGGGADQVAASASQGRREPNARVSFFDPANQAALDRLLSGDIAFQDEWDEGAGEEVEVAEETAQAMLSSVEEMLEGYEWASGDVFTTRMRGTTDLVEARLLDELTALDKVWLYCVPLVPFGSPDISSVPGEHSLVHRVRRSNSHSPQVPR